jgi:hypothetical protein
MNKESEHYRLEMLRHLQHKYRQSKPTEVLEAEQVIAKYRKEQEHTGPQIRRLQMPLPEPDLCPQCYYLEGNANLLVTAVHPNPDRWDKMKCRVCGYEEDRPAG